MGRAGVGRVVAWGVVSAGLGFVFFSASGMLATTTCFHASLSWASVMISFSERWWGTSMNILPGRPMRYWTLTASLTRRFCGMRRI